jgi:NADH-quinone oxidoreductase subunit E
MTFSPELEAKFTDLVTHYPEGRQRAALIPMLMFGQDEIGSVTQEMMEELGRRLGLSTMQVDEVVGYYSMLHKKPMGKFHVQVCTNVACMLRGGAELYDHASHKLGLGHKQVSADGRISLEEVECMGACSWAPAIQVNYDFHHEVSTDQFDTILEGLQK